MSKLFSNLQQQASQIASRKALQAAGKLTRIVGLTMEAAGCRAAIGSKCLIFPSRRYDDCIEAEVIGFTKDKLYLMSSSPTRDIVPGSRVIPTGQITSVPVTEDLLGRVIDGSGSPLDGKDIIQTHTKYPLSGQVINPLDRASIEQPLDVGIQSINGLLSIGLGQRIGLFAGSGVGKSVLLGMMTRYTAADVIVVGLIGERGREVKDFIKNDLGPEGLKRAVIVAAPADTSPLMRLNGAMWATTIAEYFRDQGANVLLLVDSLTRFAHAQRELGLAVGEPPTTKGYPPSVFTRLAQLVERAGCSAQNGGSITAIYTVLAEGDDQQDPIVDSARSFLDGHIVLSRQLADAGHYPAIDIESSISRLMAHIITPEHARAAKRFKQLYSHYQQNKMLVNVGAYTAGTDEILDEAIQSHQKLVHYLQQDTKQAVSFNESMVNLAQLFAENPGTTTASMPQLNVTG